MSLYVFASSTNPIPLSALDNNFNTLSGSINNVSAILGSVSTSLNNVSTYLNTYYYNSLSPNVTLSTNQTYTYLTVSGSNVVSIDGYYLILVTAVIVPSASGAQNFGVQIQSSTTTILNAGELLYATCGGNVQQYVFMLYLTTTDTYTFSVHLAGGQPSYSVQSITTQIMH